MSPVLLLLFAALHPTVVAASPAVTAISAGTLHNCVITSDTGAWCWGANSGQLGDNTNIDRSTPVRVMKADGVPFTGIVALSGVKYHSCAITHDGAAWCWGDNGHGALGYGHYVSGWLAVPVSRNDGSPLTSVVSISAGQGHSCATTSDRGVWCWGWNGVGQLGDGTTRDRDSALRVTQGDGSPLANVIAVSAGEYHTCAATSDGAAWCWGANFDGRLGDGTTTDHHQPVRVVQADGSPITGIVAVSVNDDHSCALASDGGAWCWGINFGGELGDGTTTDRPAAVRVTQADGTPLTGISSISAGSQHTCARMGDGTAWCWGRNDSGQLGDGTTSDRSTAVQARQADGTPLPPVAGLGAGGWHSCAVTGDGAALCWGDNEVGQLGDGTTTDRHTAVPVVASWATP